jgi:methanogenic corrinoid protein MtbC1
VLNISLLNRHGYKISKIACMSQDAICEAVSGLLDREQQDCEHVASLVMAMVELDEQRFEKIISGNVLRIGFARTFEQILAPFMRKIGVMWQTGAINLAQEHFISNLIRQKLLTAIDGQLPPHRADRKRYLLFLPHSELHELNLLYYHYLIRAAGHESIYFGQSLPINDLVSICEIRRPDVLVCVFTQDMTSQQMSNYIDLLDKHFPETRMLLSGHQLARHRQNLRLTSNMVVFNGHEDLAEQF